MSSFVRFLTISLTVIALIGQGFALAVSECEMDHNGHNKGMAFSKMNAHASHDMPNDGGHSMHHQMMMAEKASDNSPMDCCDVQCSCPANACSSSSFVHQTSLIDLPILVSTGVVSDFSSLVQKHPSRLYRPPIFA